MIHKKYLGVLWTLRAFTVDVTRTQYFRLHFLSSFHISVLEIRILLHFTLKLVLFLSEDTENLDNIRTFRTDPKPLIG